MIAPTSLLRDEPLSEHAREAARLWHRGLAILGFGLLPIAVWIALAPLSSSVVANGFVKVDLNRRLVQHQEGGLVREVRVRDGQRVRKGEPLLVLGDIGVEANLELVRTRLETERLGIARLEAEQALSHAPTFPAELLRAASTKRALAEQLDKERALFAARRSALSGQTRLLGVQRVRVEEEIAALRAQLASGADSLRLRRAELANNHRLLEEGYISAARVGQLEAAVTDYAASIEEQRSELARAQQRVAEIDLKIESLGSQYRQSASDALRESASRAAQLEQELRRWMDAAERQQILAPASGEVIHLKYATPGAVVAPRETVAEIVPRGVRLVVEARVRTEDITRISRGQAADVRLTAFKYRATKAVAGRVVYVGGDRLIDPVTQLPYYETLIETDPASLRDAGDLKLHAGMPAEVSFAGEERTVLQYLIEPITTVVRRAGRES